jgi:hypothetical protein
MKVLKRLIIWTLLPIILEFIGLFFIDKVYIKDQEIFNIKKIDISAEKSPTKIKVKVPEDAEDIKVSYNGSYISYNEDGTIYVVNTDTNDKKEVDVDSDSSLSYYRWDLESDVILMAEKFSRAGSSYLKFVAYDAKRDTSEERKNGQEPLEILLPNSNYEVKNIAFSGASNVTYVTSGEDGEVGRIYRIDRMTVLSKIDFGGIRLGDKIAAINNQDGDQIVYEDRSTNRIRIGRSGSVIATGENGMHYLLGTDNDEQVYIGNGENNEINKIFVINLSDDTSNRKIYTLPQPVNKKNIYISRDGNIYINNSSENTITEVKSKKSIEYEGEFLGIYNYGVISRDGNKVVGTLFD